MSTLATTLNASAPLEISWTPEDASIRYNVYMHFAELQMLANNEKRAFNVILNSQPLNVTIEPKYLIVHTQILSAISGGKIEIVLEKTEDSTFPPILNAVEYYMVKEFPQSETDQEDVDAITSIQSTYGLTKNSQGDPCIPEDYLWEGLSCTYSGSNSPRSRVLILDNNNFTGPLPTELIEKSKKGALSISRSFLDLQEEKNMTEERDPNETLMKMQKRQYSCSDVINITNNFDKILGKGGFGTVYLGFIDDIQVAVKMLSPESTQGHQQFQAEVKLLLTVHHRNLTSLIGYCNEDTHKGLIYEYMANGNLHEHLSGLEYLHNGCKLPIIHRDIKSTNILLNEHFQAKISDFDLPKTMKTSFGGTQTSTLVGGTPGYMDPELHITDRITNKSNVYSFGVVLLELITNQQPVITRNHDMVHISQWVNSLVNNGDIKKIVYSGLHGEFDSNSAWKAVELAMACVSPNSTRRPTMNAVVNQLKECLATALPRTNQSGVSTTRLEEQPMVNLAIDSIPQAR
ncbi:hypothetical protein L6164_028820 [Bauhinia variegata]|uniref:Uncharacterized protein n=1 Tax=Bauhinia variegata TaxID=167791 RepID=A0ACB9L6U7_BAUVA|nr:hypothetical protein L6164_028820 [Bauhinia variegata]